MSHSGDVNRNTQKPFSGEELESVRDRLHAALTTIEVDKPDTKYFDLGSPVSPLTTNRTASTTVTNTSSSSSSSGSVTGRATPSNALVRRPDSHSGELSLSGSSESSPTAVDSTRSSKPGHRRSGSGTLIYSGGSMAGGGGGSGGCSSATSPVTNVLPAGNICPSGKIGKTGMMCRSTARSDVLRTGTGNYGHGSIMRGGVGMGKSGGDMPPMGNIDSSASAVRKAMMSVDPEVVKRVGNDQYRRGQFAEALRLYDRAIALCPDNVACRSNRAAALMGMGRLGEAVRECEEAVRLDPSYGRAHQRLASLYLRLGQIEDARRHLYFTGELPDPVELQKLQAIERHLSRCADVRNIGDWKSALRESDAAIVSGADSSILLIALKAEALLRLHRLDEADSVLSNTAKLETSTPSGMQTSFLGTLPNSYFHIVRAQVEMALGRFENAELAAERARELDPQNKEIARILSNVKSVARARSCGNELFNSRKFADACLAYGEGLSFDPSNPVLYCNRAVCYSKLGKWEKSIEDCNEALKIQPSYTKALLRRAASYGKLERWAESVRDYEFLRKELPGDTEVAEALFHAQIALKTSRGEEVSNMKFGGEVEEITGVEQFQAAVSLPGVSVVLFMAAMNQQCIQISPVVDSLCGRYPSVNFLMVDVDKRTTLAKAENVRIIPTFKIYKNGTRVKEMICPSQQVLEYSVRHYAI